MILLTCARIYMSLPGHDLYAQEPRTDGKLPCRDNAAEKKALWCRDARAWKHSGYLSDPEIEES
jgi:hypothetical protein